MAIDTAQRRSSAVGIPLVSMVGMLPNATIDQAWRQQVGYGYPGNLVGAAAGVERFLKKLVGVGR